MLPQCFQAGALLMLVDPLLPLVILRSQGQRQFRPGLIAAAEVAAVLRKRWHGGLGCRCGLSSPVAPVSLAGRRDWMMARSVASAAQLVLFAGVQ